MDKIIYMIHGMMLDGSCWNNYKEFFEQRGFKCYTPTLPYHQLSPHDKPDPQLRTTGLQDYLAFLKLDIQKLGLKPILMGHSLGGLLALQLAADGQGSAAILLNPAAPRGIIGPFSSSSQKTSQYFLHVLPQVLLRRPFRFAPEKAQAAFFNKVIDQEERRRLTEKMVYESGLVAWQIGLWPFDFISKTSKVDFQAIHCPTLFLASDQDNITFPSDIIKIQQLVQGSQYHCFPNHGHWLLGENHWPEIANYIFHWLQSLKI